jgi:hypothetical protein
MPATRNDARLRAVSRYPVDTYLFDSYRIATADAIAAASSLPVVEAAEYAAQKLTDENGELRVVHAAEKDSTRGWLWTFQVGPVGTNCTMTFVGEEVQVQCPSGRRLAFNKADVRAYVAQVDAR